jgi:low affinity Fe/Cu permease
MSANQFFHKLSQHVANAVGSGWAFLLALLVTIAWFLTGPHYHYSQTWQLVINTGTTIVTFLMVFLIQNTQNRDSKAIHLKLDELIRAHRGARNVMVDLENCTEEELAQLQEEFERVRRRAIFRDQQKQQNAAPTHGAANSHKPQSNSVKAT